MFRGMPVEAVDIEKEKSTSQATEPLSVALFCASSSVRVKSTSSFKLQEQKITLQREIKC